MVLWSKVIQHGNTLNFRVSFESKPFLEIVCRLLIVVKEAVSKNTGD